MLNIRYAVIASDARHFTGACAFSSRRSSICFRDLSTRDSPRFPSAPRASPRTAPPNSPSAPPRPTPEATPMARGPADGSISSNHAFTLPERVGSSDQRWVAPLSAEAGLRVDPFDDGMPALLAPARTLAAVNRTLSFRGEAPAPGLWQFVLELRPAADEERDARLGPSSRPTSSCAATRSTISAVRCSSATPPPSPSSRARSSWLGGGTPRPAERRAVQRFRRNPKPAQCPGCDSEAPRSQLRWWRGTWHRVSYPSRSVPHSGGYRITAR